MLHYQCRNGYTMVDTSVNKTICLYGKWTTGPTCSELGRVAAHTDALTHTHIFILFLKLLSILMNVICLWHPVSGASRTAGGETGVYYSFSHMKYIYTSTEHQSGMVAFLLLWLLSLLLFVSVQGLNLMLELLEPLEVQQVRNTCKCFSFIAHDY